MEWPWIVLFACLGGVLLGRLIQFIFVTKWILEDQHVDRQRAIRTRLHDDWWNRACEESWRRYRVR